MLVAAGGGELNREAMRWVKSGDEIRGPVLIVAKDQLPTRSKKIAKAGAQQRSPRIEAHATGTISAAAGNPVVRGQLEDNKL